MNRFVLVEFSPDFNRVSHNEVLVLGCSIVKGSFRTTSTSLFHKALSLLCSRLDQYMCLAYYLLSQWRSMLIKLVRNFTNLESKKSKDSAKTRSSDLPIKNMEEDLKLGFTL